jgi:hypothetical protein
MDAPDEALGVYQLSNIFLEKIIVITLKEIKECQRIQIRHTCSK